MPSRPITYLNSKQFFDQLLIISINRITYIIYQGDRADIPINKSYKNLASNCKRKTVLQLLDYNQRNKIFHKKFYHYTIEYIYYKYYKRMRKAERLSHMFEKLKKEKIKQSQDTWRSQFQQTDQERLQRANLDEKYRDLNKERKIGDEEGQDGGDQQAKLRRQMEYDEEARRQEVAEVEGEKIYLKGLDLGMLKREKELERKTKVVPDFTARINEKMKLVENVKKVGANRLYRDMIDRIKSPNTTKPKPTLNQNTHYQFDINWTFGSLVPKLIVKHPPKHHKNPSFPGITSLNINQMISIIERKHEQVELQRLKQTEKQNMIEQDSDDIFAEVKQDNIKVGAKLEFGVGDIQDLYEPSQLRPKEPTNEIDMRIMELEKAQKRKKMMTEDEEADYYEQFWGSGPSLEHLKNLRKEGISYYQFYDEKSKNRGQQQKEKKVDYNKEYDKIQRIIAEKEGKPK